MALCKIETENLAQFPISVVKPLVIFTEKLPNSKNLSVQSKDSKDTKTVGEMIKMLKTSMIQASLIKEVINSLTEFKRS